MTTLVPVLLCAAAVAVAMARPRSGARLEEVLQVPVPHPPPEQEASTLSSGLVRAACVLAAGAVALVVGGPVGVALALLLVLAGPRGVAMLQPDPAVLDDEAAALDLPLALDLLSACLVGGAGLQDAARVVGRSVAGPCGARLERVAQALALGVPPSQAWSHLGTGDGTAGAVARALSRSAEGGAPVAATVARAASTAREASAAAATRRARRAGVLAVAPLGLCFLPAFLLLGVVPAVVGLAAPLLAGF